MTRLKNSGEFRRPLYWAVSFINPDDGVKQTRFTKEKYHCPHYAVMECYGIYDITPGMVIYALGETKKDRRKNREELGI